MNKIEKGKKVPEEVFSQPASRGASTTQQKKKRQNDHFARAANEDDDGYDPWSDRKASNPLWEEDPWR